MPLVFKKTQYPIIKMIEDIDCGDIALPDIQRPFVWDDAKVRDLFDSLFKGFPVGYLLFWENNDFSDFREIGADQVEENRRAKRLIIDGQQRLTALYSVLRKKKIIDKNFREKRIKIAFNPLEVKFEVPDASTSKNPEFIPDISDLWENGKNTFNITRDFLEKLKEKKEITDEEEAKISENIGILMGLERNYEFVALEIQANLDEETVADIFVRINNQGVKLTQSDFVLTLLSVFWDEGRRKLENFAKETRKYNQHTTYSAFNKIIQPEPSDLLRVATGLAFRRGKMKSVYHFLRGKNVETEDYSSKEEREKQLRVLKEAVEKTLDNTNWHNLINTLKGIGYKNEKLISAENAVYFSYLMYLIGKVNFGIDTITLQKLLARWYFFVSLTGRYSSSPETALEKDLLKIRELTNPNDFITTFNNLIKSELTDDFWEITLPKRMETSSSRSPEANAYYAGLVKLGAPALFSNVKNVADLLEPEARPKKQFLEKHHIFPKNYLLKKYNFDPNKDKSKINQIANLTFITFEENIFISDKEPKEYFDYFKDRFSDEKLKEMMYYHALPNNFYEMEYDEFLDKRRKMMAEVIKKSFEKM